MLLVVSGYSQITFTEKLDQFIPVLRNDFQVPGLALAVIEDGRIVFAKGYGLKELGKSDRVDENTVSSDTHKVDYVKGEVAFDLEWNAKDQTFDRDLYAFRAFFEYRRISVAILITRDEALNDIFKAEGLYQKYGASTTHINKLIPRLQAGRSGGCPVLVFGITPKQIVP